MAIRRHARSKSRRIHCARTRRADAVDPETLVLEQAVENPPGEGAVRAAALQG
jgi:hypothetical protein